MGPLNEADDRRWIGAALTLAARGRGRTAPNPNVGCVLVRGGHVVGRGWTRVGGRPHAEAVALAQAGDTARGATCYVTLEPCAHRSMRGPACSDLLIAAGVARVVMGMEDPDPRTAGAGSARLRAAGIAVTTDVGADAARRSMAGFLTRRSLGRPFVTLKLATSLDGKIATASGESRWITGPEARAHVHLERSRHEAILVGRGTWEADSPRLDVRLPGLEGRSPRRVVLSSAGPPPAVVPGLTGGDAPSPAKVSGTPGQARGGEEGWRGRESQRVVPFSRHPRAGGDPYAPTSEFLVPRLHGDDGVEWIGAPEAIAGLYGVDHLFVEGGARAAAAFLAADLVDRLLLYRAPILIGGGTPALADIGLASMADAHGRWRPIDARALGSDRMEVYERSPCSPA